MRKDKSSIHAKFLKKMIIIVFASIGLWSLIWIHDEYSTFYAESESLRKDYILSQKLMLKTEVGNVVRYINDIRNQSEQKLEVSLKERVYEAHQIALNIYQQNSDSKDPSEIQKMIKDALRNIRFHGGRGYYFAGSVDGICHLNPVQPDIEGTNIINLMDSRDNYAKRDEIDVVKTKKEGFVTHHWPKPGRDPSLSYAKKTFVKYFKPLNWYLGTSDYIEDANEHIKNETLAYIVNFRFEKEGYFFGSTFQGAPLFSNGKITIGSDSIWNLTDPNGVKIIQEQIKTVKNSEGGFVSYVWHKLNNSEPSPKMSFVQGVPEWEWTIGAGIYLDTIEKTISENEALLIERLKKRIFRSVLILTILLCLVYFWSRRISVQLQKSVDTFSSFLSKSSIDSTPINPDTIELKEFRDIAISANKMLGGRKQAEENLKLFQKAVAKSTDAIGFSTSDGQHWYQNTAFDSLFGKIGADPPSSLYCDENIGREVFEKIMTGGEWVGEVQMYATDRQILDIFLRAYALTDESGKVVGLVGVHTDISKSKQAESEKLKAQKIAAEHSKHALVGQIAGKMAHDFNNILGIIMGNTELAILDSKDPAINKTLDLILEQTVRGKNLTMNLLAFARDHEPKQVFFKISEKIDLVLNLMRKDLVGIEVVKEDVPGTPEILADPGMIEHALVNLIQNSIHAVSTTENPAIYIRTYCRDDKIHFEIEDNGCGIPKAKLSDIFNPSFTLKGSRDLKGSYKNDIKGTGYGMSNVKKYIEQHLGSISVESVEQKGTTFLISLPVTRKKLTDEEIIEIKKEKIHFEKHILLVEDETAISNIQYRILTEDPCNHTVDIADNGQMAIDLFERNKYDFVSLDYTLPGDINGRTIYNHIRKKNKKTPILFISGNIEFLESIKELKIKDAWVDHLSKPCRNLDYLNSINRLLSL